MLIRIPAPAHALLLGCDQLLLKLAPLPPRPRRSVRFLLQPLCPLLFDQVLWFWRRACEHCVRGHEVYCDIEGAVEEAIGAVAHDGWFCEVLPFLPFLAGFS